MKSLSLFVDFPYRAVFSQYQVFDIASSKSYIDEHQTSVLLTRLLDESYLPTLKILVDTCRILPEFKVSISFSPLVVEHAKEIGHEFYILLKRALALESVELVAQKYYGSLDLLNSQSEYLSQLELFQTYVESEFSSRVSLVKNQEFTYTQEELDVLLRLGFKGVLARTSQGVSSFTSGELTWCEESSSFLSKVVKEYSTQSSPYAFMSCEDVVDKMKLDSREHQSFFLDARYFGFFVNKESGIFDFLKFLGKTCLDKGVLFRHFSEFMTLSEVPASSLSEVLVEERILEAKEYHDFLSSPLQVQAGKLLLDLEDKVKNSQDEQLVRLWRMLGLSEHFYLMNTHKFAQEQEIFAQDSAYGVYISFMNCLTDLQQKVLSN